MTQIEEAKELLCGHFDNFIAYSNYIYKTYSDLLKKNYNTTFGNSEMEERESCLAEIVADTSIKCESTLYKQQDLLANTVMNIMYFNKSNKHLLFNMYKDLQEFIFYGYWKDGSYIQI
jgi:hypothetical protein